MSQTQTRLINIIASDRAEIADAATKKRHNEIRRFFYLVKEARDKLPASSFNDWLATVGFYGSLSERLEIAEVAYREAITFREVQDNDSARSNQPKR